MSLAGTESSFRGSQVSDRDRETVPGGQPSNGKIRVAVPAESVMWYMQ